MAHNVNGAPGSSFLGDAILNAIALAQSATTNVRAVNWTDPTPPSPYDRMIWTKTKSVPVQWDGHGLTVTAPSV